MTLLVNFTSSTLGILLANEKDRIDTHNNALHVRRRFTRNFPRFLRKPLNCFVPRIIFFQRMNNFSKASFPKLSEEITRKLKENPLKV